MENITRYFPTHYTIDLFFSLSQKWLVQIVETSSKNHPHSTTINPMGKASKWFRGLLGLKKSSPIPPSQPSGLELPKQPKRRWNFVKSYKEREREREKYHKPLPPKTLYSNTSGLGTREEWAVVKIQSNFRAYLSRRALRALKALVKLQALVRGHIVRKQTADMLQCMQSLLRAQARARAGRAQISDTQHSITKSSLFYHRNVSKSDGKVMVDVDHEKAILDCKRDEGSWTRRGCSIRTGPTDENRDKILEIEMGKPHVTPKRMIHSSHHRSASDHNSHSFTTSKDSTIHQTVPSPSYEVQSLSTVKLAPYDEETSFCTAENSPQFYSASSKGVSSMRGTFTPMSDGSRSYLSGYSDHPNYMASTASSKAKIRSLSAPRPRPQFEMSNTTKRYGQRVSELRATFTGKAYPGSGRMERLTMHASSFTGRDWRI